MRSRCSPRPGRRKSYEVTDLVSGAVAVGTVTTDLPATTLLLAPWSYVSVGGVSSVVGMMASSLYLESDY
jgi:membrane-associated PAP2 superfamily phosphatase